ncbi:MAG: hypothetical protein ACSLE6_17340 [Mycobacterium sp.]
MTNLDVLPIPAIETATDPVHCADDLCQRWRALMGPLGFGERILWYGFVGPDRRLLQMLHHVPLGPRPKPRMVDDLMTTLDYVITELDAGLSAALLLTRPGRGGVSPADKQWATLLTDAATRFDVPIEPIFRANDESVAQVALV